MSARKIPAEVRFYAKIQHAESGCWVWTGTRLSSGYGQIRIDGKGVRAHRYAFKLMKGDIPAGLVIDHLCRNTLCVNPSHLEAVSHRENILRGEGVAAKNSSAGQCHRGHLFTVENTHVNQQRRRVCRTCARERVRLRRAQVVS